MPHRSEEGLMLLGQLKAIVESNADEAKRVRQEIHEFKVELGKINDKLNETDTALKVMRAKALGFFAAVSVGGSLLWAAFSERITELKQYIFG